MADDKVRSTVFSWVEDYDPDATIKAELTTSNGGTVRDCIRITLGNTRLRLNVPAAVDLVDEIVNCLAQLDAGGDAA